MCDHNDLGATSKDMPLFHSTFVGVSHRHWWSQRLTYNAQVKCSSSWPRAFWASFFASCDNFAAASSSLSSKACIRSSICWTRILQSSSRDSRSPSLLFSSEADIREARWKSAFDRTVRWAITLDLSAHSVAQGGDPASRASFFVVFLFFAGGCLGSIDTSWTAWGKIRQARRRRVRRADLGDYWSLWTALDEPQTWSSTTWRAGAWWQQSAKRIDPGECTIGASIYGMSRVSVRARDYFLSLSQTSSLWYAHAVDAAASILRYSSGSAHCLLESYGSWETWFTMPWCLRTGFGKRPESCDSTIIRSIHERLAIPTGLAEVLFPIPGTNTLNIHSWI